MNGLPTFRSDDNTSELTTRMVQMQNQAVNMAARQRRISREVNKPAVTVKKETVRIEAPEAVKEEIRYERALPGRKLVAQKDNAPIEIKKTEAFKPGRLLPVKKEALKFYTVEDGDNLFEIAMKVYGPEEGNKRANITKLPQNVKKS